MWIYAHQTASKYWSEHHTQWDIDSRNNLTGSGNSKMPSESSEVNLARNEKNGLEVKYAVDLEGKKSISSIDWRM